MKLNLHCTGIKLIYRISTLRHRNITSREILIDKIWDVIQSKNEISIYTEHYYDMRSIIEYH